MSPIRCVFLPVLFALAPCAMAQPYDFVPTTPEVVLNTSFCTVQTANGPLQSFYGGVFVFRDIHIPSGVTVRGVGPNPLVLVATRNVVIDGQLTVRGGDGQRVNTLNSANFPAAGGVGGAGGGSGGAGSPQTTQRSLTGQQGFDFANQPIGGAGGLLWNAATTGRGSGGGGGAFGTQGDPWFLPGAVIAQLLGIGGSGGPGASGSPTRTLAGGVAGTMPFTDAAADNDFFGVGYDLNRRRVVVGELPLPIGGQGGGGGGDRANGPASAWINDSKGGGGGGGGGCLVVHAQGILAVTGRVSADGGHGGGGEQAGSCNQGGGGGAGSGGMVILASRQAIALVVKGETFARNDYRFVVSADGGVCLTGTFGVPVIDTKYPPNGIAIPTSFGINYDSAPLGAFGGMGVVQLMAPPGNNIDGTNTVLDDSIILVRDGNLLLGSEKQRYLAWRGFQNAAGVFVDDFGVPTNITREGDIRPSPVLLPLF